MQFRPLADRVVVLTLAYRDDLRAGLGAAWREDRVSVIPNGIEPKEVDRVAARRELAAAIGLDDSAAGRASLIVTVGRLWPQKRHKDLIWGTELLRCVRDDAHLLVIGEDGVKIGIEVRIDKPREAGADRLVNVISSLRSVQVSRCTTSPWPSSVRAM